MSASSPAFKVFGYGMAPEAPEHQPYNDGDIRAMLAEHETRIKTLEKLTASFEEQLQTPVIVKPLPQILAEHMDGLRAAGVSSNYQADDLKLCAEFAAHAAEGNPDAIQALTPLADALGVSVEQFVQDELARESARRGRVIKIRAAEIAFLKRIDAASDMDALVRIRDEILAFTL